MSSAHQPIYWDSRGQSIAAGKAHRIDLPIGTTSWTIANPSATGTDYMFIAGTAANIAVALNRIYLAPGTTITGKGQTVYVLNATGGALESKIIWERPGRQPDMDAGTATFTEL